MTINKYLIINPGSASKKYAFFIDQSSVYTAHFEKEDDNFVVTERIGDEKFKTVIEANDYQESLRWLIKSLKEADLIKSQAEINFSGIRIVASGTYFYQHRLITPEYLAKAEESLAKTPLHLAPALEEVKKLREILGPEHLLVGVSDSAFHASIPDVYRYYGIPIKDSRAYNIERFGYHGLSVQSVVKQAEKKLGSLPDKVIVCHLGGGASVTAVKAGQSLNTTMGFTPLEGLLMATRVGDIDPGVVTYLMKQKNYGELEMRAYLNNQSGLLGLSGISDDIRGLLAVEDSQADARLALAVYVARIKQEIGRMAANLGGVDLLIFAGTVGERSFIMRGRIVAGLEFLGLELNQELNRQSEGVEVWLSSEQSRVKVLVAKTDETLEIAQATQTVIDNLRGN
ncbi:MAG: acetate/propionate family kinase [Patescibacteria group bacterium]|jgi:acetate kinase